MKNLHKVVSSGKDCCQPKLASRGFSSFRSSVRRFYFTKTSWFHFTGDFPGEFHLFCFLILGSWANMVGGVRRPVRGKRRSLMLLRCPKYFWRASGGKYCLRSKWGKYFWRAILLSASEVARYFCRAILIDTSEVTEKKLKSSRLLYLYHLGWAYSSFLRMETR